MNTNLQNINDTDRIWIYQSPRPFSPEEEAMILQSGAAFAEEWTSHNKKVYASVWVLHRQFIIVAVDESKTGVGGCSIHKSITWLKGIGERLQVDLLDRLSIAWLDENQQIRISSPDEFEALIAQHQIEEDVMVFNNLIFNGKDLKTHWNIPARESWQSRYFALV